MVDDEEDAGEEEGAETGASGKRYICQVLLCSREEKKKSQKKAPQGDPLFSSAAGKEDPYAPYRWISQPGARVYFKHQFSF